MNLQGLQAAVLLLQADHLIAAEGRLVKADGNLRSQIRALLPAAEISEAALIKAASRALASPSMKAVASMEKVSKKIAENVTHIAAFKMKFPVSAVSVKTLETVESLKASCAVRASIRALSRASVKGRVAKAVIKLLLFRITQHLIGFRHLLKHLLRVPVARVRIGMIFLCQLSVCFFNRCGVRVPVNAQHFIIISLTCHMNHPFSHIWDPFLN